MVDNTLNERRNAELNRQHAEDARRSSARTLGVVGCIGTQFPVEIRECPAGSRDEVFKAALADAPARPLFKSETPTERKSDHEIANNRQEQEGRVRNLIKRAHANGQNWNPLCESQDAPLAKLQAHVGLGETCEIDLERGEIHISKVA